jgi:hypothetical protein
MRARDIITIAEAFKVYDAYREQTVFIHHNPSKSIVDAQFKRFTYLRGLLYGGNSLYVWDAELLHDEVVAAIGRGAECLFLLLGRDFIQIKNVRGEDGEEEEMTFFAQNNAPIQIIYGNPVPLVPDDGAYM